MLTRELGGEDSNPQRLDQNQLCYRLHHPRKVDQEPYPTLGLVLQAEEAVVADEATDRHGDGLAGEGAGLAGGGEVARAG
jgi:hypothetical protein